jgi:16S rRNA processing protein RimM
MNLTKEACFYLGHVSKVRGFKGEVLLHLDVDDPTRYRSIKQLLIDLNGQLQPFFIQSIHIDAQGFARTTFEGIEDRNAATEIAGKELYLPLEKLPELPDHQYYLHELEGMEVTDVVHGRLGTVDAVFDYSHNPVLQVFRQGYEVLIPLQDSFVKKVNKKDKSILVEVPVELLEMNKI